MGCDQLPESFHGKQGVCRGLPPGAGGPLPAREGVDTYREGWLFLYCCNPGHEHSSQPQPVHASRIMQRFYRGPGSG